MYYARHRSKKKNKKFLILLSALAMSLTLVFGTTLAFLSTQTDSMENTFQPAKVTCEIGEEFDGTVKKNVIVKNTGAVPAYIRASIVVTWVNSDGSIAAEKPVKGTDYKMIYAENTGWFEGADGYWYYTNAVSPGSPTNILIQECKQVAEKCDCKLVVEILASAIQSKPAEAVTKAWAVTVNPDGAISK